LLEEFDGPEAATLEFFGGSDGSHASGKSGAACLFDWPGWNL
jgi:hypothetical protein